MRFELTGESGQLMMRGICGAYTIHEDEEGSCINVRATRITEVNGFCPELNRNAAKPPIETEWDEEKQHYKVKNAT